MRSDDLSPEEVERYAGGEMSPEESAAAAAHLRDCARCAAAVVEVLQMKRAIRDAVPRSEPPRALRDRIEQSIRAAATPTPLRPRSSAPWWIATAAMFFLAIVVLGALHARSVTATREFADMHATLLASAHPVEVVSTDKHTVKPWFEGRVPFAVPVPDLAGTPFTLLGGRTVFWRNTTGACLLVGKGAHRISVFVFPAESVPMAAWIPSVSTLFWRSGGLAFIEVADVPREDLVALRRAFQ